MKNLLFSVFAFSFLNSCLGQTTDLIQEFIAQEKNLKSLGVVYPSLVSRFYNEYNFQLAWVSEKQNENRQLLFEALQKAEDLGLNEHSYHYDFIKSIKSGKESFNNWRDSLSADVRITDAAIHFYSEVKNGIDKPSLKYDGLKYEPEIQSIPVAMASFMKNDSLANLVSSLEPNSTEYRNVKNLLLHFNQMLKEPDFREVIISSTRLDSGNVALRKKLFQLGFLKSIDGPVTIKELTNSLIAAQKLLNVLSDGVLRSTGKEAMNVSLETRRKQLLSALNYLKWINDVKTNDKVVLLNIPSATLFVYSKGEKILESRVVVGKPTTPTPRLSSTITEVIMYPYWNVPNKIATRELLPSIKRNINFLAANNFQVLNKQGNIVDPYKINWASLGPSNFPYLIRQSTGCDNSLGIVKLNFYNPFSVYLHDTPGKGLFFLNKRYFSHGCMRVEEAMALAKIVARDQALTIDRLEEEGCLKNQQPVILKADDRFNLFIIYSVAWYDKMGNVIFFDDPYRLAH